MVARGTGVLRRGTAAPTSARPRRRFGLLGLVALTALAGCESQFRQDPLLVRGSTKAVLFSSAPLYVDRPIKENLQNSLVFADYVELLRTAGLLDALGAPGPLTVFALTNPAIETIPAVYRDRMLAPQNLRGLRQLLAYTIVPGRFTADQLVTMIRQGGGRAGLRTLEGSMLGLRLDPTGRSLEITDPEGRVGHVVLLDVRQSNGRLYATDGLLAPN